MGARILREVGRPLTISELAELKDFKINYRTDNTKDERNLRLAGRSGVRAETTGGWHRDYQSRQVVAVD
ncbi:hypothetical protein [Parapedobacter indicus]|uniref:hypothetical protein n=1 Tax=Parapedobacter indicus TaxID=1477437 RepID=UPI000B837BB9|nr:hypothetical protein [Parapedobacter indicus]